MKELRRDYLALLVLLVVQFMLGMAVNLFVQIPLQHPGANPPEYFTGVARSVTWAIFQGPVLLILHASLGLFLVLSGLRLLVQAVRSRTRGMIIVAGIGGLAILAAGFNGGSYLNYHEDFSSMLMSAFFAIALVTYAAGLYLTARSA